jgi:hypothetical protein
VFLSEYRDQNNHAQGHEFQPTYYYWEEIDNDQGDSLHLLNPWRDLRRVF